MKRTNELRQQQTEAAKLIADLCPLVLHPSTIPAVLLLISVVLISVLRGSDLRSLFSLSFPSHFVIMHSQFLALVGVSRLCFQLV